MAVCTFDNPATMRRECWQDGRLLCSYAFELYVLKEWPVPGRLYFFGANIGDWKTGQLVGDSAAMEPPLAAAA
jgi:hypothetical protein